MRNISIKWRMTLWFSLLMIAITALMLVFVMLMNRNTVTRPPEAELLYMVGRNADDVEFDHGGWDFSDVEQYGPRGVHGRSSTRTDSGCSARRRRRYRTAHEGEKRAAHRRRQQRRDVSGVRLLAGDGGSGLWVRGHHRQRGTGAV